MDARLDAIVTEAFIMDLDDNSFAMMERVLKNERPDDLLDNFCRIYVGPTDLMEHYWTLKSENDKGIFIETMKTITHVETYLEELWPDTGEQTADRVVRRRAMIFYIARVFIESNTHT